MSDSERAKVLIVDDLPEKLLVYRTMLDELDQELVLARSGLEALKLVLRYDFAVILLDVNMPDMDGFETASLIRRRKRSAHTPIIFITAYTDDLRIAEGYALGAVDCIMAPVAPAILRAKVMVFVSMHRLACQARRQAEERLALVEERSRRTAAEESNRRLEVLANAGRVIGSSLDFDTTLRDLVRLALSALADFATVAYQTAPGSWSYLRARRDAESGAAMEAVSPKDVPPALLARIGLGFGGQSKQLGASCEVCSWLVETLQARNETLAVLVLERPLSRPFEAADATLFSALASRAAVALDNALLYESLQRADRQKNEFLSMLAHELRNPLAPVRTGLEMLRLGGGQPAVLSTTCEIMERQVRHLVRLVDDLLDVSRFTQGKIQLQIAQIDAAEVVRNALEISRPAIEARRHALTVDLPAEPVWLEADLVRLTQVVSNLLNNSAKYTEDHGSIEVSLKRDNGFALIGVRDSGVGISPEMLDQVFDLFVQADRSLDRSAGGLGVGLTLARHLIDLHGGTIEASSEGHGRGSEFVLRLPTIAPSTGADDTSTISHNPSPRADMVEPV